MSRFLLALLLASSAFAEPLLDGTDEHYLTLALQKLQMTPADLSFKKDNSDSEFITREALIFLHDPVALALDAGEKLTRFQAVTNLTSLVAAAVPSASSYRGSRWDGGHYTVGAAVARITAAALKLRARLPHPDRAAFDAYVVEQLDRDAAELGVSPELLRRSHDLELQDDELAQPILRAGRSFTPPDITELCHAIDVSIAELRQQHFTNEFTTVTDSPLGKIIIGGVGPNVYREDAFQIGRAYV